MIRGASKTEMKYLKNRNKSLVKGLLRKNALTTWPSYLKLFMESYRAWKMSICSVFTFEPLHSVNLGVTRVVNTGTVCYAVRRALNWTEVEERKVFYGRTVAGTPRAAICCSLSSKIMGSYRKLA